MACIKVVSKGRVVAIDGKDFAGKYHNEGRKGLIYMVTALSFFITLIFH